MALPPVYNRTGKQAIYAGDIDDWVIRLRDASNVVEDLTGKTAQATIRRGTVSAAYTCTVLPNGTGDVDKGKIHLVLSNAESDKLRGKSGESADWLYDVQLTNGDGIRNTRLRGKVTVLTP